MQDSRVHNLRAAFIAGLAHGMDKTTTLVQAGDDPVPLDYRDFVDSYRHPGMIDDIIERFALEVTDALQAQTKAPPPKRGLLASLDMGSSTAENEFVNLGEYYVQTDQFRRALRGEVRIVVGRKGSGKTAVFAQVRDHIRPDRSQIVLDLKPEGYQLRKFKEQVLDLLEAGTREHTITAFWEYLLLLEVAYKILEKDRSYHVRDQELYEPYQTLARIYKEDGYSQEGDFSERMLRLTEQIAATFQAIHPEAEGLRLTRQQVTEFLYVHDIRELRGQIERYLKFKVGLWILFDNLDKGWSAHGLAPEDLLIIRCLLDATRKMEQSLQPKGVDCHTIVFLRNDVYSLLVEVTPDRGKEIRVSLDWAEPDLLRDMLRRRLVYNGLDRNASFEQLWRLICVSLVDGEETSQYLIERSMMRPRFLLTLISHCRGFAVNFDHEKIDADDIRKGLDAFSTDLIYDIDLEIRDVLPFADDVLYAFLGQSARLTGDDIDRLLGTTFDADARRKIVNVLLWYGVLGVVRPNGEVAFIYSVNYDMKRLNGIIEAGPKAARRGEPDRPEANSSQWYLLRRAMSRRFCERNVMECRNVPRDHSGLMPANWITFAHFSDSVATKAPKSAALKIIGMVPSSASRDLMVGFASPALISWLRRAMISGGVPFGTPTPAHVLASYPGTVSAIVGTSGSMSNRLLPATPSARSAPVRTCGSDVTITSNPTCTCPATRSVIMGALPR
jgi:hypothetical protein